MAAGLGRSRLSLEFGLDLADPLESIGATVQFLRQLVAPLALAVLAVLLGVDQLGLAQQGTHLALQLPLGSEHPLDRKNTSLQVQPGARAGSSLRAGSGLGVDLAGEPGTSINPLAVSSAAPTVVDVERGVGDGLGPFPPQE